MIVKAFTSFDSKFRIFRCQTIWNKQEFSPWIKVLIEHKVLVRIQAILPIKKAALHKGKAAFDQTFFI
ncbi:hypothetical protein AM500_13060 [Bacillus sp. FJAT-18017]|nr:hypothetical protein AM500_13060 [Bacillus sp. FJAT-18017]